MTNCIISQEEQVQILKAYRKMREENKSNLPFFLLVQYVPLGKSGKVVCRPVLSPTVLNGK